MPAASGVDAEALRAAAQNVDADAGPAFPMWVLPVKKLLELEEIITHEALQAQGSLVRWEPGMQTLFVSHTWLRHNHPDGVNKEKLTLMKRLLGDILAGTARDIHPQWALSLQKGGNQLRIKAKDLVCLRDGYVWLDLASIPQADKKSQPLAIASIPQYISASNWFMVLSGPWTHENGEPRGILAWSKRGWCRLEQLANYLSATPKPVLVVQSATMIEAHHPVGWISCPAWRLSVGNANFTVDEDRRTLGPVILQMIQRRQALALEQGDLVFYRLLKALTNPLLHGTGIDVPNEATVDDWLVAMRFASATDKDESMSALHYAVFGGRQDIAEALLARGANVNATTKTDLLDKISWVDKKFSVLHLALLSRNQPRLIQMLLDHGANARQPVPLLGSNSAMVSNMFTQYDASEVGDDDEWNVDVLFRHDPGLIDLKQPIFGIQPLAAGNCFGHKAYLEHMLKCYPERSRYELGRIDGVGATWLTHHIAYTADPEYMRLLFNAGLDVTLVGPPERPFRIVSSLFILLAKLQSRPSNAVFHFAAVRSDRTPPYLHIASMYAQLGALDLLLGMPGVDVNWRNCLKMTPLHLAARNGHDLIVDRLLAAGADLTLKDRWGRTPVAWARRMGYATLVGKLTAAAATVTAARPRGGGNDVVRV
jgi:hypothetical protein